MQRLQEGRGVACSSLCMPPRLHKPCKVRRIHQNIPKWRLLRKHRLHQNISRWRLLRKHRCMPLHVACTHSPLGSIANVRWAVVSAKNATSTVSIHAPEWRGKKTLISADGTEKTHMSGNQLLSAHFLESTIPHLTNTSWAHMHAAVRRSTIHPGSSQRIDRVVHRSSHLLYRIDNVQERAGKASVSSLAHIPCSQLIKH